MCLTNFLSSVFECIVKTSCCCTKNPTPKKVVTIIFGIVFAILALGASIVFGLSCANVIQIPDPAFGSSIHLIALLPLAALIGFSLSSGCFRVNNRIK